LCHDLPLDPELAARRKERNERRNALALTLRQRWPDLFTGPSAPWAVGMHRQIVETLGCDEKDLRAVLSGWSQTPRYQKTLLAEGAQRRNLDGSAAGEVTSDQRERAASRLAQLKAAKTRDGK
jgi:sRNA-binding protein